MKTLDCYCHPTARESHGGHRLVRKAEFNAGSHINTMFRMRCRLREPGTDRKMTGAVEKRNITYFGKGTPHTVLHCFAILMRKSKNIL